MHRCQTFDSPSRLAITARILDISISSYGDGRPVETAFSVGLEGRALSVPGAGAAKHIHKAKMQT